MEISQDTKNVVDTVESFTERLLLKKNDFSLLLELAVTHNHVEAFPNAVFNGTAFYKLSKQLKKPDISGAATRTFKVEFENYLELFKSQIKTISESLEDKELIERFETTYFLLTRGCVLNLIDLAHDFSLFKEMQIYNKENQN
jgi:hypothetical protein